VAAVVGKPEVAGKSGISTLTLAPPSEPDGEPPTSCSVAELQYQDHFLLEEAPTQPVLKAVPEGGPVWPPLDGAAATDAGCGGDDFKENHLYLCNKIDIGKDLAGSPEPMALRLQLAGVTPTLAASCRRPTIGLSMLENSPSSPCQSLDYTPTASSLKSLLTISSVATPLRTPASSIANMSPSRISAVMSPRTPWSQARHSIAGRLSIAGRSPLAGSPSLGGCSPTRPSPTRPSLGGCSPTRGHCSPPGVPPRSPTRGPCSPSRSSPRKSLPRSPPRRKSGPRASNGWARAMEWQQLYLQEVGRLPDNANQFRAFVLNRGGELPWSVARRALTTRA